MRIREVVAALAMVTLLATNRILPQSSGTTPPATPRNGAVPALSPVNLDIHSASITDALPFDVPFRFTGNVPPGALELHIAYAQTTELLAGRNKCEKAVRNADERRRRANEAVAGDRATLDSARADTMRTALANCRALAAVVSWLESPPQSWRRLGPPGTQATPFSITMPTLDAEEYYRFRITLISAPTEDQATAFRRAALAKIDALLANMLPTPIKQNLSPEQQQQLWTALRSELRQAVGPALEIRETSIFSNAASWDATREVFRHLLRTRVVDPQADLVAAVQNHSVRVAAIDVALRSIAGSAELQHVLAVAAVNDTLARALAGKETAVSLTRIDATEASRLARGQSTATDPDLASSVDSAAVIRLRDRYPVLADRLRALRQIITTYRDARGDPTARQIAKLIKNGDITEADTTVAWALARPAGPIDVALRNITAAIAAADIAAPAVAERRRGLEAVVTLAAIVAREVLFVEASTTGDESTVHSRYVSADAGYFYSFGMRTVLPYVGTNIYFGPVNKNAPLSQRGSFKKRFSLTIALALKSVGDDEQTRRDLPQLGKALVVGGGFRIRQSVRLGGGLLLYQKKDEDHPLRTSYVNTIDPFGSLSFDLDVQNLPARLGELFK